MLSLLVMWCVSAHSQSQTAFNLDKSTEFLMPSDWSLLFTDSDYRKLVIRYQNSKVKPRWTAVMDDAMRRYGVTMMVDFENSRAVVAPADGFRQPGLHYIHTQVPEQVVRYRWERIHKRALQEAASNDVDVQLARISKAKAQSEANQREVTRRVELARDDFRVKIERNNQALAAAKATLQRAETVVQKKSQELTRSRVQYDVAKAEYGKMEAKSQSALTKAEATEITLQGERVNLAETEEAFARELAKNERQLTFAKEQLVREKYAYQQKVDQQYLLKVETLAEDEKKIAELKAAFYPDVARTLHAGEASESIQQFLATYWKYNLAWSDELVRTTPTLKVIELNYPLYFSNVDLYDDISLIVCALTRDYEGLTIYAEVDAETRLVTMQLHRSNQKIRNRILRQCFE